MAADASAVAERVLGETSDPGFQGQYEWEWLSEPSKVTKNPKGATGWGKVCRSSNPRHPPGTVLRLRLCAHNPCQARWASSKYGMAGPPAHAQAITCMGPAAAPLLPLQAAPPASADDALDIAVAGAAVAGAAVTGDPAVAAQIKVSAALLHLARELRRPRAYVGYIAFILFGLRKACRPCAWEGESYVNMLEVFAPWALPGCPHECAVTAIPCALVGKPGGMIERVPISEEVPLSRTCHYVAGVPIPPQSRIPDTPRTFETFYSSLGVCTVSTVCDGDCALDVMTMMLGLPQSVETRKQLRVEISDYFLERIGEQWMPDLLVAAQELDKADVDLCISHGCRSPAPAVADPPVVAPDTAAPEVEQELAPVTEETMDAMRWASRLDKDATVLGLIRCLPQQIVEEQVALYRNRDKPAVADARAAEQKLPLTRIRTHQQRMSVAVRFHKYCKSRGIHADMRMPYGAMKSFIQNNIVWTTKKAPAGRDIAKWCAVWRQCPSNIEAAVAERTTPLVCIKSLLKSRATKTDSRRQRAPGAGRHFTAPLVRQELYHWWTSIRYAIDWKQLAIDNRSRGLTKIWHGFLDPLCC